MRFIIKTKYLICQFLLLSTILNSCQPHFEKGGKFTSFSDVADYPVIEETFLLDSLKENDTLLFLKINLETGNIYFTKKQHLQIGIEGKKQYQADGFSYNVTYVMTQENESNSLPIRDTVNDGILFRSFRINNPGTTRVGCDLQYLQIQNNIKLISDNFSNEGRVKMIFDSFFNELKKFSGKSKYIYYRSKAWEGMGKNKVCEAYYCLK